MSVFIQGMKMPESCSACPICYDAILCPITQTAFYDMNHEEVYKGWNDLEDRLPNCPLSGWTSIDDRLPEIGEPVLGAVYTTDMVFCEDGETIEQAVKRTMEESVKHPYVTLCFYEEDGWNGVEGFPMICAPKFWTELPEPPKVKDWRDL